MSDLGNEDDVNEITSEPKGPWDVFLAGNNTLTLVFFGICLGTAIYAGYIRHWARHIAYSQATPEQRFLIWVAGLALLFSCLCVPDKQFGFSARGFRIGSVDFDGWRGHAILLGTAAAWVAILLMARNALG
ncbi:MAG: hypothetical protein WCA81_12150 [Rhizomicrobium sp.]